MSYDTSMLRPKIKGRNGFGKKAPTLSGKSTRSTWNLHFGASDEASDMSYRDELAASEKLPRLPLSACIALLLTIAGLTALFASAVLT